MDAKWRAIVARCNCLLAIQFATRAQIKAEEIPKQLNHLVRRAAPRAARGNRRQKNQALGNNPFLNELNVSDVIKYA